MKLSLKVWPDPELFGVPPAVKLTGICEGSCVPLPAEVEPRGSAVLSYCVRNILTLRLYGGRTKSTITDILRRPAASAAPTSLGCGIVYLHWIQYF